MARNDKQWSSATPGYLIILLDQSGSMTQDYDNTGMTRSEVASLAVDKVIDNIIQKNFAGEAPKNRCFISVIGYNHNVQELCSGWLSELDANPLRYDTQNMRIPDGNGGFVSVKVSRPVWVEPITTDGSTNMYGAFVEAKKKVTNWMAAHTDYPAPVIINISDGTPYYDGEEVEECMQETVGVAQEIMRLSNSDGNVLIFNAQIDTSNGKVVFPADRTSVLQREAQFLFDITSEVPESYKTAAAKNGLPLKEHSRGCIFGANAGQLSQLIDFGSSKGLGR